MSWLPSLCWMYRGMTEFDLGGATLGLMPAADMEDLLAGQIRSGTGQRCELYLRRADAPAALARAAADGGRLLDGLQDRSCGERVGYALDPDGHVLALAVPAGLRGGGGNFGVATRLEFQLHPLRRVLGGRLTYAGTGVGDALRRFRDLAVRAPRDLSCQAVVALDGSLAPALIVAPCYTGPDADPEQLSPLRTTRGLADDGVRAHSFLAQQHVFNPGYGVDRNYWKGHFVRELPDELIDELIERMMTLGRPPGQLLFESLHGAPKDADRDSAALGYRHAAFNISVMAAWLDPALDEQSIEWARATAAAIEPWSVSGGYMNYMQADEPIERVRAAFGDEAFERLQALKRRYDPDNVLHRNQNIPPQ